MASNRLHITHHVGASWAGIPCTRELWLRYRNVFRVPEEPAPVAPCGVDICTIGKEAEAGIVAMMRAKGHTIYTTPAGARKGGYDPGYWHADPYGRPDEQIHILHPDYPYISGYLDGVILDNAGKPGVLEIKTMASHKFYRCKERGICAEYPQYHTQIQIYMHLTGMRWGLFAYAARGEDGRVDPSIEWFVNTERIDYNPAFAVSAVSRVIRTVTSTRLPGAPKNCPSYCRYYPICSHAAKDPVFPVPTCRTCSQQCPDSLIFGAQTVCERYTPIADILPADIRKSYFTTIPVGKSKNKRLARYLDVSGLGELPGGIEKIVTGDENV